MRSLPLVPLATLSILLATAGCPLSHTGGDAARNDVIDVTDAPDLVDVPGDDGPPVCPAVAFVAPVQGGQPLGPSQDIDGSCGNGFQYDVVVSTNAQPGVRLQLLANNRNVATATVAGAMVTFPGVEFNTTGTTILQVRVVGGTSDCAAPNSVTVLCGTPTCAITEPTRTTLNASDNESSVTGRFATHFAVQTDIEDGLQVSLEVAGVLPQMAPVSGGSARFAGIALNEGTTGVRARCVNRAGTVGLSASIDLTVDTTPPALASSIPTAGTTIPFSAPDVDPTAPGRQFQVCARTEAVGQVLTALIHGTTAEAIGMVTVASATADACAEITCPSGSAPFDVDFSVSDAAGNRATVTVAGVSCASNLPSVRIVDPVNSVLGTTSTYLNASRDTDAARGGLQYDIVACADRDTGLAQLLIAGAPVGSTLPLAAATGACATAGFRSQVTFAGVTLPESLPAVRSTPSALPDNPSLTVRVTDGVGDIGLSPAVTVFVDGVAPSLSLVSPTCGVLLVPDATGSATTDIQVRSTDLPVTLTLQRGSDTPRVLTGPTFFTPGFVIFSAVSLGTGTWTAVPSGTDVAGNAGSGTACAILVGNPPTLSFTAPSSGQVFGAAGDAAPATSGYQGGTVTLTTDAPDGSVVTLTVGTLAPMTASVSAGIATFANVTFPEADALAIGATVTVAGRGNANATVTVVVDTQPPSAPTGLTAVVAARRGGRIHLSWTAPSDPSTAGGRRVVAYQLAWSLSPITDANFPAATAFAFVGTPAAPGSADGADAAGLQLGVGGSRPYYFAVRASDAGNNVGPIVASSSAVPLDLTVSNLQEVAGTATGFDASGGFDLNGDRIADVVVGSTSGQARVYFGSSGSGISTSSQTVINGVADVNFGQSVVSLGDINGDSLGDIAVGSPSTNRVYVFYGRSDTGSSPFPRSPTALTANDADVTISTSGPEFTSSYLGGVFTLARADFDGDGTGDLIMGAQLASPPGLAQAGSVAIIRGRSGLPASMILPADADAIIHGAVAGERIGRTVQFAGLTVGGDSREDIVVGSHGTNGAGNVYVFAGRALATPASLTSADASFTRVGTIASSFEINAAMPGDINGDGRLDLAVGPVAGGNLNLFFGNASGLFDPGPVIPPALAGDAFGRSVSSLTRSGISHPSLLFGSPTMADLEVGESTHAGGDPRVELFSGRASWVGTNATSPDSFVVMARVRAPTSRVGVLRTLWVGDVDNDGFEDLLAGQFLEDQVVCIH